MGYWLQTGIDERKNRGIGADRDREGADGRGGEEAVSAENPGRIMEVLPDGLDHTVGRQKNPFVKSKAPRL